MKRSSVRLCVSARLSLLSTAAVACGGFPAERPAGRTYRSIAAVHGGPAAAFTSKCGQRRVDSRRIVT